MPRVRTVLLLSTLTTSTAASVALPCAAQVVTRYGAVWHEGRTDGPFVPFETELNLDDLTWYMGAWDEFRVTDFELADQSCPPQESDLTASQWERGVWYDEIIEYPSLLAFEQGLIQQCEQGMVLHDFESWGWGCSGNDKRIVALFREGDCNPNWAPHVAQGDVREFDADLAALNDDGWEVVDFEVLPAASGDPTDLLAVVYEGEQLQLYLLLERPEFESTMIDFQGTFVLEDMESFRADDLRQVSGLWNLGPGEDDHEVGEVRGVFAELFTLDDDGRKLVDLEAYYDVDDQRFRKVAEGPEHLQWQHAYGLSVMQKGDIVAEFGRGQAIRPVDGPAQVMDATTAGVSASVTKFVTALGVLRYSEVVPFEVLDTPFIYFLPPDFEDFGEGVEQVTVRDLLMQRTGLSIFVPPDNVHPIFTTAAWRDAMIEWLQQPLEFQSKPYLYQNIHFELLALIMENLVQPYVPPGPDPWRTWINDEVLAPAGIGPRVCRWQSGDALSYPYEYIATQPGVAFNTDATVTCAGNGTGAAMFWLSPRDLALLGQALYDDSILMPDTLDELLTDGLGLEQEKDSSSYAPWPDDPLNVGESFHWKGGSIGGWNSFKNRVGSETAVMRYEDLDLDDLICLDCNACACGDYRYERGFQGLSAGMAVHSSAVSQFEYCDWSEKTPDIPDCTRLYPHPVSLLMEAFLLPEDW